MIRPEIIKGNLCFDLCRFNLDYFDGEEWIGASSISVDELNSVGIWDVEIDPKFQGKGYGNIMMSEIVDFILKNIMLSKEVYLYVRKDNIPAIKAYLKTGFEIIEKDSQLSSEHSYYMRLKRLED